MYKRLIDRFIIAIALLVQILCVANAQPETSKRPKALNEAETAIQLLSGTGSDHTVPWDFYCTAGKNSGKWTTIAVPSNWELQGFGGYNYGLDKDSLRINEKGIYRHNFQVPADWKGKVVHIVFDGVMTDAAVKVNGKVAGPVHQGAFYTFRYDISKLLRYGKQNQLEVTVSKNSANASVNSAERKGDFWIFGGIFRPVYLEAMPPAFINRVSVDAKGDGHLNALLHINLPAKIEGADNSRYQVRAQLTDSKGTKIGPLITGKLSQMDNRPQAVIQADAASQGQLTFELQGQYNKEQVKPWTPETPHMYKMRFQLWENGKLIHALEKKIGFRTVEVRPRDGIYVNGVKIKFKGVNHHSFWPSTGRTTSKRLSIQDVLMLKDMNMNAVRMSHYPPDEHFLDACDSLGLFVLDELTGWHHHYDTQVGSKLVAEMIIRDENHPSIVMWDNGNEGGFNFDLDSLFDIYDLQKRPLIHPWAIFGHMDTQHYINYDYGNGTHLHGHEITFPTEFLHGLYDGGLGAGLGDYWREMWQNPLSAGGFLWVFADEAVVRTDKDGKLDADGDHGPDGIVGPYHEKEGSYYAIKDIWSPVFIEHREITPAFDGKFRVENRYNFTNLNSLRYQWALMEGGAPSISPSGAAYNHLSTAYNALSSTATVLDSGLVTGSGVPDVAPHKWGTLQLTLPANFEKADYLRLTIQDQTGHVVDIKTYPIKDPAVKTKSLLKALQLPQKVVNTDRKWHIAQTPDHYEVTGGLHSFSYRFNAKTGVLEQVQKNGREIPFNNGPVLCDGQAMVKSFTLQNKQDSIVLEAVFEKKSDLQKLIWTIYPDGVLKMEAGYFPHQYDYDFMGLSFNFPENLVTGVRRMGAGPYRVWKNRMEGVKLGNWENAYNNTITGENVPSMVYPEFKGYFANLYWMQLQTKVMPITVLCGSEDVFLRLYTPESPKKPYNTAPKFPTGEISFMHAIDPIGTKSQVAENMGPSGRKNMYYDYGKSMDYAKPLTLYFIFGSARGTKTGAEAGAGVQ
ncbi:glycoside hydrolase family 2 [Arachidicoccus ginsenosidivorans]